MENTIPIVVLNILRRGNLKRFLIEDHNTGTVVSGAEDNYAKD